MAVLGLLKIKVFWVIIYVHDVTNKNLSCDSNYNVDAIMWTKLGNSSTSIREVIITSIIKGFNQMNQISWELVLVQISNLELALGMVLKFSPVCQKG